MTDEIDFVGLMSNGDPYEILKKSFARMAETTRRLDLLRSDPASLDEPVYVEIDSDRIAGSPSYDEAGPKRLDEFIAELRAKASEAPEGCPVFVEFDHDYGYDGDWDAYLKIGYKRPPTDDEKAERLARNEEIKAVKAEAANVATAREREELARLKTKFGETR